MTSKQPSWNSLLSVLRDAQTIRQLEEQIKRLQAEVQEFFRAEKILVAAGLVSEARLEMAHEIVRTCS